MPLQVPSVVVRVEPTVVVPEITGGAELSAPAAGGAVATVAVWAEVAEAEPALLAAVTTTCSFCPASAATSA